jgi:hypothetical protein
LDPLFAAIQDNHGWWQLEFHGVTLSDSLIVPNIPNLGNKASSHNKMSSSASIPSSSDTDATNTIYSGDCEADPGVLDNIRQMLLKV